MNRCPGRRAPVMSPDRIADDLARRLEAAIPDGLPEPIPTHVSLTGQLGLDSLVLMTFLTDVRADYGVDLGPWLIARAARGRDTLDSLAAHLAHGHPTGRSARQRIHAQG